MQGDSRRKEANVVLISSQVAASDFREHQLGAKFSSTFAPKKGRKDEPVKEKSLIHPQRAFCCE